MPYYTRIDTFVVTTGTKCLYASHKKPADWLRMNNNIAYTTSLTVLSTKIIKKARRHIWTGYEDYIFAKAVKELMST
jgi:hypothetical protein